MRIAAVVFLVIACTPKPPPPDAGFVCDVELPTSCSDAGLTYTDVKPVIDGFCVPCHYGAPAGPWPLTSYSDVPGVQRVRNVRLCAQLRGEDVRRRRLRRQLWHLLGNSDLSVRRLHLADEELRRRRPPIFQQRGCGGAGGCHSGVRLGPLEVAAAGTIRNYSPVRRRA